MYVPVAVTVDGATSWLLEMERLVAEPMLTKVTCTSYSKAAQSSLVTANDASGAVQSRQPTVHCNASMNSCTWQLPFCGAYSRMVKYELGYDRNLTGNEPTTRR